MLQTRRDLTQQEYTKHIDFLHQQLVSSWAADQRVTSLKIAIQNAKTMTNTEVLQFYPSKFVLSTEILDTFGKLVYERILERSGRPSVDAPPSSDPQAFERNESAKEMCKNWFYKIASIRELIPRMYIEMALLACYRFLSLTEYDTALERLAKMCRGIGDPLIAAYCRAYICRKGMEVSPKLRKHLYIVFEDFCTSFSQLTPDRLQHILRECELSFSEYLALFVPALEWILQCLSHRSSDDTLNTILHWYERCNNSLVLDAVMTSFDPKYVSDNALRFADLIKKADGLGCPQHQLYMSFGLSLVLSYPDKAVLRRILRDHWKVIVQLENPDDFLRCADVYIEIPAKHFTAADVDHLLGDIVRRVGELPTSTVSTGAGSPGAIAAAAAAAAPIVSGAASPTAGAAAPISTLTLEQALPRLQSILDKILTHLRNFSDLFEMRHFLPMVDLFQTDLVIRNEVCKSILTRFAYPGSTSLFVSAVDRSEVLAEATQLLTDLPRVNTMMYFAKSLHDSVNIMTVDDERRQITELILAFVRRWLVSYIANVASFLIGLPGSPDQGPFFILRQFLEALESYPWNNTSDGKAWCFLSIMKALSHLRTNRSRFNYLGVIPNSVLYDSDDRYEAEVDSLLDIIAEQVTAHLADLKREDSSHAAARRATLSLHLSHILNDYFSCTEATGAMALLQSARANLRETSSHLPTSLHALFRSDPSVVS
ncbi:hypothetical protein H696_00402 [Fonticula alba]|uniref:Uncharacterized protein n=1 Tax=Fonticula alba TaxID=691883 RepID=A0A058ZFU7_FONAL|nr:hypothetical protein H696_00402 [Fonticula alba]KCV72826.1 hypothetical protein H696_00402 [Fonticula alba]|eukprot:XP_009492527.1 hypothetical protein H696_00402 [Fonticula alba]